MVTSGLVTANEVTDIINDELPEVYRLLVEMGPSDYYSATETYTTTPQVVSYSVPANFFQEVTIYALDINNYKRPLLPVQDWSLARVQPPQGIFNIVMEYIPAPPVLSDDMDTFDGVAGWDSLLTCRVARRILQKRKTETSSLDAEIGQLTAHLMKGARRDKGPRYVRDIEDTYGLPYAMPYLSMVSNYRVRGSNVEFYQTILAFP